MYTRVIRTSIHNRDHIIQIVYVNYLQTKGSFTQSVNHCDSDIVFYRRSNQTHCLGVYSVDICGLSRRVNSCSLGASKITEWGMTFTLALCSAMTLAVTGLVNIKARCKIKAIAIVNVLCERAFIIGSSVSTHILYSILYID